MWENRDLKKMFTKFKCSVGLGAAKDLSNKGKFGRGSHSGDTRSAVDESALQRLQTWFWNIYAYLCILEHVNQV